ncbi:hypothetical protein AA0121_g4149 [Alternaria tenuissima]|uniref:Ig-like domain-containing protein n=1 Tax=Alternaria tenuissima TaxID=119927 RepID=A0AB37WL80_9PLEO|nr:hypothetical protein AA0115_g4675 [Alternaria tenuissima]RYO19500.1 hypothetical protein AA0121_g4149 [Alternaria tenuissima]RYO61146.1 hypothetical protein AA0116_g6239 [Alternaria tenuissima]
MKSTKSLHREASQSTSSVYVEPKHDPVSTATPLLDPNESIPVPQGWPTSPSSIKHPMLLMLLHGAFDMALIAFSVSFLAFSIVVMSHNGDPTSENPTATSVLLKATKYGPTVFPLLFASVVGRATHATLLWRLEKGERIEILDTLATSTSLTSTITSQIQLRQINILSVLLVIVWALSPIGGQASLRQMSIEMMEERSDALFQYVVPLKDFRDRVSSRISAMNNIFISAIFAAPSSKSSPIDVWGNVKIPKIEYYEKSSEPDNNGWFNTVPSDDNFDVYASFVGTSIDFAEDESTTTDYDFYLQTEYLQLICTSTKYNRTGGEPEYRELPPDALNETGDPGIIWWSENDIANRRNKQPETLKPFKFTYDPAGLYPDATSFSCSVENSYVEVGIFCAGNSTCRAIKVRRSQLPQLPPAFTFMDLDEGWQLSIFMKAFMKTIGGGEEGSSSSNILNDYLVDPPRVLSPTQLDDEPEVSTPDEAFSERLGQLMNSYWTCICGEYTIAAGINANTSDFWDTEITFEPPKIDLDSFNSAGNYNWTYDNGKKSRVWSSKGHKVEHVDIIIAHKAWAITLYIASLVLIVFSLIPPIVRHFFTAGPDIAMNFSSLATRNNAHVPIPAGGSFLPASDRFRLLKDLRLRFADAESKSDVGTLVIAAQGVEKAKYSRVRKGRLYE